METGTCEKIIDQFIDSGKINTDMQIHINSCPKCQETIKKLALIGNGPPPTHTTGSPDNLLKKFSNSASVATYSSIILNIAVAIAVTGSIAVAIYSGFIKNTEIQTNERRSNSTTRQSPQPKSKILEEEPLMGNDSSAQPPANNLEHSTLPNKTLNYNPENTRSLPVGDKIFINPSPTEEIR